MHCGNLGGKEIQKRDDIYTPMVDSFCYTLETNTSL